MGVLSQKFDGFLANSSMIRRMFEAGIQLRKEHGADKVFDFSLGNPDLPPPAQVADGLRELANKVNEPFSFGYMPNAGFPWALELMSGYLSKEQGVQVEPAQVMLSCGAAGALNAFFKAILNPGDEVLCIAPYFVEYGFYIDNHGGVLKPVDSRANFSLDLAAVEAAFTPKTRAIIVNSPNNPTGQIYSKEELKTLAGILRKKSVEYGRPIFLASDEPYRFLAYDNAEVPSVLPLYEYSVVLGSFAKNLSLPGERIGYLLCNPDMPDKERLMGGAIMANRILGYVNPPLVGQYIIKHALGHNVDLGIYAGRREAMAEVLKSAGYEFSLPRGAFYFFPKAPGGDDKKFIERLTQELVLAVPGSGFGRAGHFRLAFCANEDVIKRSTGGFKRARDAFK